MGMIKSTNPFPGYRRVREPDKDKLADIVVRAKGKNRSLTEFAKTCGVSPSTISRIINKKTIKANSNDLIAAIAENADPAGGVTLSELLDAHGLQSISENPENFVKESKLNYLQLAYLHQNYGADATDENGNVIKESALEKSARWIIQNELLMRGYNVSLKFREDIVSLSTVRYISDFTIETNALEMNGILEWAFDVHRSGIRPIMQKLSWVFGAAYLDGLKTRGIKVSLITVDIEEFKAVKERFQNIKIKDCISVILIDNFNRCILEEFQIPMQEEKSPIYIFKNKPEFKAYEY